MIEKLSKDDFDSLHDRGSALVGSPDEIVKTLLDYHAACGGFEVASAQFYFSGIAPETARTSLELFAKQVVPQLKQA
jgi:alkanesulfonate monooxygenase SsuD/methylene tetrahydromethanopterin reductase-like flavin-dependent oxidoreductase (luciferase family)